jgi:hypothetical protein
MAGPRQACSQLVKEDLARKCRLAVRLGFGHRATEFGFAPSRAHARRKSPPCRSRARSAGANEGTREAFLAVGSPDRRGDGAWGRRRGFSKVRRRPLSPSRPLPSGFRPRRSARDRRRGHASANRSTTQPPATGARWRVGWPRGAARNPFCRKGSIFCERQEMEQRCSRC